MIESLRVCVFRKCKERITTKLPAMCSTCAAHVRYMCGTCALHVHYMCGTCAVHVRYMCITCAVHMRYMCSTCAVHWNEYFSSYGTIQFAVPNLPAVISSIRISITIDIGYLWTLWLGIRRSLAACNFSE